MKKNIVIISVIAVVGIVLIILIVMWQKRKTLTSTAESNALLMQAQADAQLTNAQAMEDCKSNWLCALSTTLGGVGNVIGAVV